MMSHHIHSYICFILKPRKIWWSQGSCCHPWASLRYKFPQMHLKRSRKNCSQRNFTVKNSFFLFPWPLMSLGVTGRVLELILAAHEPRQGPPLKESPAHRSAPYVSIWPFGSLLKGTSTALWRCCCVNTFPSHCVKENWPHSDSSSISHPFLKTLLLPLNQFILKCVVFFKKWFSFLWFYEGTVNIIMTASFILPYAIFPN